MQCRLWCYNTDTYSAATNTEIQVKIGISYHNWSVSTFGAVLGPLFLLPFGRPLGRFGVGGPTGSCRVQLDAEP